MYSVWMIKESVYPLYISNKICDKTCNLILIENHYVWIKDFNKLMNTQSKDSHKLFFCYYCLQLFTSENILKNHTEVCLKINGTQKVKMPCKNKNIFFLNYHKQLMASFVIYADFECITVPINEKHGITGRGSSIDSEFAWHASGPSSIPTSGTVFRGDLVMKTFLRPFSFFR